MPFIAEDLWSDSKVDDQPAERSHEERKFNINTSAEQKKCETDFTTSSSPRFILKQEEKQEEKKDDDENDDTRWSHHTHISETETHEYSSAEYEEDKDDGVNTDLETIWETLLRQVPAAEVDEIRRILGYRSVEENQDLAKEVRSLKQILTDLYNSHETARAKHEKQQQSLAAMPVSRKRAMLEDQIALLLHFLSERETGCAITGVGGAALSAARLLQANQNASTSSTSQSNDNDTTPRQGIAMPSSVHLASNAEGRRQRAVIEYVNQAVFQRETGVITPRLRPNSSMGYRPTSALSTSRKSTVSAPVAGKHTFLHPLRESLNVEQFTSVAHLMRAAMAEEKRDMLEAIDRLQACLELEFEEMKSEESANKVPGLDDLRACGNYLEKAWLDSEHADVVERAPKSKTRGVGRREFSGVSGGGKCVLGASGFGMTSESDEVPKGNTKFSRENSKGATVEGNRNIIASSGGNTRTENMPSRLRSAVL